MKSAKIPLGKRFVAMVPSFEEEKVASETNTPFASEVEGGSTSCNIAQNVPSNNFSGAHSTTQDIVSAMFALGPTARTHLL